MSCAALASARAACVAPLSRAALSRGRRHCRSRRALAASAAAEPPPASGTQKVCVITGANTGLGFISAREIAAKGHVAPHERTHTGEEPFKCSMCPKRFNQKGHPRHPRAHAHREEAVPVHYVPQAVQPEESRHIGEKPFKCTMCPQRFNDKSLIALHERTHTGEKPFK